MRKSFRFSEIVVYHKPSMKRTQLSFMGVKDSVTIQKEAPIAAPTGKGAAKDEVSRTPFILFAHIGALNWVIVYLRGMVLGVYSCSNFPSAT